MMGLTDDRDISETVSETWSTDVLGSDFDPNMDEDRLQEIAGGRGFVSRIFGQSVTTVRPILLHPEAFCGSCLDSGKCHHLVVGG